MNFEQLLFKFKFKTVIVKYVYCYLIIAGRNRIQLNKIVLKVKSNVQTEKNYHLQK